MKLYKSPYNKIVKSQKYGYLLFAGNTGTIKPISLMLNFALNTIQLCLFWKIVNHIFSLKKVFFKRKLIVSCFEKNLLTYLALYVW